MRCVKASPVRGDVGCADRGVHRRGDDPSPGAGQWQVSTGSLRTSAHTGVAIRLSRQKAVMFHRTYGSAAHCREYCKNLNLLCKRGTDCHVAALAAPRNDPWTNCARTPLVQRKTESAMQNPSVSKADIPPRRRKVHELRFRLWGEKLRSLPFSSFPHRTHFVGLRRGPPIGELMGCVYWLPCKGSCQRPKPLTEGFQSVPQGHHNRSIGAISSARRADFTLPQAKFHPPIGRISLRAASADLTPCDARTRPSPFPPAPSPRPRCDSRTYTHPHRGSAGG